MWKQTKHQYEYGLQSRTAIAITNPGIRDWGFCICNIGIGIKGSCLEYVIYHHNAGTTQLLCALL